MLAKLQCPRVFLFTTLHHAYRYYSFTCSKLGDLHLCSARSASWWRNRHFVMQDTSGTLSQGQAVMGAAQVLPMTDVASLPQLPLLGTNEPHAPIASLTRLKRAALMACYSEGSLQKRNGVWTSPCANTDDQPIASVTVADLARDGLLVITAQDKRNKTAQLTARGNWFARTIGSREMELYKASCI